LKSDQKRDRPDGECGVDRGGEAESDPPCDRLDFASEVVGIEQCLRGAPEGERQEPQRDASEEHAAERLGQHGLEGAPRPRSAARPERGEEGKPSDEDVYDPPCGISDTHQPL
jgi:hypothetical protein